MGALHFTKDPLLYNFSRNRMFVEITTDNHTYNVNYGQKAYCYFAGMVNAVLNDTLTIHWGPGSKVFTFKAATNIGANEIAHPGVGQDPFEYINQLANDLMSDVTIAGVMNVWAYQTSLYFEALVVGSTYTFAGSGTTVSVGFHHQIGTDDIQSVVRPNYRICVDVYSGADLVASIAKEPVASTGSATAKIQFDLAEFVDNYLEYDRPTFVFGAIATAFKCEQVIKTFHYKISEVYGETPVAEASTVTGTTVTDLTDNIHTTGTHKVLKAGFDELIARSFPISQFIYHAAYGSFLTRQPRTKYITRTQREWLYFIFAAAAPPAGDAWVKYTYYDAHGVTTDVTTHAVTTVAQYDVYAFPVNASDGTLATTATYVRMDVRIVDNTGTALSEVFTYYVDEEYRADETLFHYDNADGGFDTVRMFGHYREDQNVKREVAERTRTVSDSIFEGDRKTLSARRRNGRLVRSGFQRRQDLRWAEDMLVSLDVFVYALQQHANDTDYMYLVPVQILTEKLVPHETNKNLFAWEIEYSEGLESALPAVRQYAIL